MHGSCLQTDCDCWRAHGVQFCSRQNNLEHECAFIRAVSIGVVEPTLVMDGHFTALFSLAAAGAVWQHHVARLGAASLHFVALLYSVYLFPFWYIKKSTAEFCCNSLSFTMVGCIDVSAVHGLYKELLLWYQLCMLSITCSVEHFVYFMFYVYDVCLRFSASCLVKQWGALVNETNHAPDYDWSTHAVYFIRALPLCTSFCKWQHLQKGADGLWLILPRSCPLLSIYMLRLLAHICWDYCASTAWEDVLTMEWMG